MKTIVKITQKELDTAVEYERHLRKKPCKDCPPIDKIGCCGCHRWTEWHDNLPDIGMTQEEYNESLLKHYASAKCNYENAERRRDKALTDMKAAKAIYEKTLESFEVKG